MKIKMFNEYAGAIKTGNWTFMVQILWNEKTKKLESKDNYIENLGDTLDEKKEHLLNYIIAKLSRFFGTSKSFICVSSDTVDFITIQIAKDNYEISFQKSELPKLLNETIYPI